MTSSHLNGSGKISAGRSDRNGMSYMLKALRNFDRVQIYGSVNLKNDDTSYESKGGGVGLDYQISDFYIGPEISYSTTNSYIESTVQLSLEAGYRANQMEIFARYGTDERRDFPLSNGEDLKEKLTSLAVGGSFHF